MDQNIKQVVGKRLQTKQLILDAVDQFHQRTVIHIDQAGRWPSGFLRLKNFPCVELADRWILGDKNNIIVDKRMVDGIAVGDEAGQEEHKKNLGKIKLGEADGLHC